MFCPRSFLLFLVCVPAAAFNMSCSSKKGGKVFPAPIKPGNRGPWTTQVVAIPGGVAYSLSFPRDCEIVVLMDDEEAPRQTGLRGVPFCHDGKYLWAGTEYEMIYPKLTRILLRDGVVQEVEKYRPKKIRPNWGMDFVAVADGGDSLWVSYQGFWRFDKDKETFFPVEARWSWEPGGDKKQLFAARDIVLEGGMLWLATGRIYVHELAASTCREVFDGDLYGGAFAFESAGDSFLLLDKNQPAKCKGRGTACFAILVDGQHLWCSPRAVVPRTRKFTLGISRYDISSGAWKTYVSEEVGLPRHGPSFICTDIAKVGPEIWFSYKATQRPYEGRGLVVAHNPTTGKWRQPVRGRNVYSIAVSNEYVYLGVDGGAVRRPRPSAICR